MATAVSSKLVARVIACEDFDRLFPSTVTLKGQIALDVYIDEGTIAIGKKVWLSSRLGTEELMVKGIELKFNRADPTLIRIHCSRPTSLAVPLAMNEQWTLAE